MPDSPVHAKMLTHEERIAAIERVRDDQGGTENRRFKKAQVYEALSDVRTWLIVLSTFLSECKYEMRKDLSTIFITQQAYRKAV